MGKPDFENLEVYKLSENLANEIWNIVEKWDYFARHYWKTNCSFCGQYRSKYCRLYGRGYTKEYLRFLNIARGSINELETHLILSERIGLCPKKEVEIIIFY